MDGVEISSGGNLIPKNKKQQLAFFSYCMKLIHTSDYCVVEENKDDEGGVEEGESN